jgi:hypothetical protein
MDIILGHLNPVHILTPFYLRIQFNILSINDDVVRVAFFLQDFDQNI